jgi:uncharacterized protein with PQ loop repeat
LPQAWRLWVDRRDEGLSLASNVFTVLFATAWVLYGVASHRSVQVATAAAGLAVAVAVLAGHAWLSRPPVRTWLPLWVVGTAFLLFMFSVGRGPLGLTASGATIVGVLPQLVSLVRARRRDIHRVSGVSITRWVLSVACNVLWFGYGVLVHDPLLIGNCLIIGTLSMSIVVLTSRSARSERLELLDGSVAFDSAAVCA